MICKICGRKLDFSGLICLERDGYDSIPCAVRDLIKRIKKLEKSSLNTNKKNKGGKNESKRN